jgi:putative ABC transport system substrate-binding protein
VISGQKSAVSRTEKQFMNRKIFYLLLVALLFALCVTASAQQVKKVTRIGYLSSFDPATESTRAEGIRVALRELGYIEGQNIATDYRYAEGKIDRFLALAAELVRLKVDIIMVAGGGRAPLAAKNARPRRFPSL